MKLQIPITIVIVMSILTGFGMAQSTGETTVEGNILDVIILQANPTHILFSLNPDIPAEGDDQITVNSDGQWKLEVKSDEDTNGHMTCWDSSNNAYDASKKLVNPMEVTYALSDVQLSSQNALLMHNMAATCPDSSCTKTESYLIHFKQQIDPNSDLRINDPGMYYRIMVIFTASMDY